MKTRRNALFHTLDIRFGILVKAGGVSECLFEGVEGLRKIIIMARRVELVAQEWVLYELLTNRGYDLNLLQFDDLFRRNNVFCPIPERLTKFISSPLPGIGINGVVLRDIYNDFVDGLLK